MQTMNILIRLRLLLSCYNSIKIGGGYVPTGKNPLAKKKILPAMIILLTGIWGCRHEYSAPPPEAPGNLEEISTHIERFSGETTYHEIVRILGKPYREFITPSLPGEYCLYFKVPEEPQQVYWIMLDTQTKQFLYWSGESP